MISIITGGTILPIEIAGKAPDRRGGPGRDFGTNVQNVSRTDAGMRAKGVQVVPVPFPAPGCRMDYRTRLLSEWDVADVRAVTIAYRTPMLSGARVETCHHAAQAVLRVRRPDIPEGEISGTVSHMIAVVIREHGPWFYGRGR